MLTIRPAVLSDREEIYRLIEELESHPLEKDSFNSIYQANLDDPQVYYYVALESGQMIGFISLHIQKLLHHTAKIAEIQELIVTKNCQSKGVGKQLFDTVKEDCLREGCFQLEVSCNKSRTASHPFYTARGMENSHYKFCLPLEG